MLHTFEEVDGLVSDEITSKILCQIHAAHNRGTTKVSALEQFNVAWSLGGRLELNDTTHHSDGV